MDQVTELLNNMSEEERAAILAASAEEEHITIDAYRKITVPEALQRLAVQFDHNMETVTFDCPRYWDGVDMKDMVIYINYVLPDSTLGTYVVEKAEVDTNDDSIIHFNWTISHNVTQTDGKIAFAICIRETDDEGFEIRHWNTEINNECYISKGLTCGDVEYELSSDLIAKLTDMIESRGYTQLLHRVDELETGAIGNSNAIAALSLIHENLSQNLDTLTDKVLAMEEEEIGTATWYLVVDDAVNEMFSKGTIEENGETMVNTSEPNVVKYPGFTAYGPFSSSYMSLSVGSISKNPLIYIDDATRNHFDSFPFVIELVYARGDDTPGNYERLFVKITNENDWVESGDIVVTATCDRICTNIQSNTTNDIGPITSNVYLLSRKSAVLGDYTHDATVNSNFTEKPNALYIQCDEPKEFVIYGQKADGTLDCVSESYHSAGVYGSDEYLRLTAEYSRYLICWKGEV